MPLLVHGDSDPGLFRNAFLICFAPALFQDRQFGYRDAGHYYYPLHGAFRRSGTRGGGRSGSPGKRGHAPSGQPYRCRSLSGQAGLRGIALCLGSEGLYRRSFGARVSDHAHLDEVVGHELVWLCVERIVVCVWPSILFQYCNIIYLVGAAWLPLGIHAVDRWVRLGRRGASGSWRLSCRCRYSEATPRLPICWDWRVLDMRSAWRGLEDGRTQVVPAVPEPGPFRRWLPLFWVLIAVVVWSVVTLELARWLPRLRAAGVPRPPLRWMPWLPSVVTAAWVLIAVGLLYRWRGRCRQYPLGAVCLGLVTSAALAVALTAAQLLPVIEFTQQTRRAADEGLHEMYQFSLEPFRLLELAWPNILGNLVPGRKPLGRSDPDARRTGQGVGAISLPGRVHLCVGPLCPDHTSWASLASG